MEQIKDINEIRRRIRAGEYVVNPGKSPSLMSEDEFLKWDRACLQARLLASEDPRRKSGYMIQIQKIDQIFRERKAKKAYKKVISGPFETDVDYDADLNSPRQSEPEFETEFEDEEEDEDEEFEDEEEEEPDIEELDTEENTEEVYNIEDDPLFN